MTMEQAALSVVIPGPLTPVLANRPLREDADPNKLSRFQDLYWDLSPGIFEEHYAKKGVNFSALPERWRGAIKRYFWHLINEDSPRPLAYAQPGRRPSLSTISLIKAPLFRFISWADVEGIRHLGRITANHLDAYLTYMSTAGMSDEAKKDAISEVRRLWSQRDIVDPILTLPSAPPWNDAPPREILGITHGEIFNRTPRIAEGTLVPLIGWAVRFVDEISPDILANYNEFRRIALNEPRRWRAGAPRPTVTATRQERLTEVLQSLSSAGLGIPGNVDPKGNRSVRWAYLGRLTHTNGQAHSVYDQPIIAQSGLPIDDDAYLMTGCHVRLDGTLWHDGPMKYDRAIFHATLLTTACFVVISYLSGMRPGEVLSLRPGCLSSDPETDRLIITGIQWKSATDEVGSKAHRGEERKNPWVVHPAVARAVAVLEELHDHTFLFPKKIHPWTVQRTEPAMPTRLGQAKTSSQMAEDIVSFVEWVNEFCGTHNRADRIPEDPNGRLSPTRFRRTLAWHIVRRPRGLVAAAIQYGHVNVQITKGYAGNYDSGFPDELAFEQWLERLDRAKGLEEYIDSGGTLSGPAAGELERRVRETRSKFAGRVISTGRQADKLLRDPVLQVFPGKGVHCVFDRSKALCTSEDQESPHLTECRSACQNIARTDDDIAELARTLQELPNEEMAPPIRYLRISSIRQKIRQTIETHKDSSA